MNKDSLLEQFTHLFSLDDLQTICDTLGINFEEIPGETITRKSLELIRLAEQKALLSQMVTLVQKMRPDYVWPDVAEINKLLHEMLHQPIHTRGEFLDKLVNTFNLDDARTHCYKLGINYEDVGGEERLTTRYRELILLLMHQQRLVEFVELIKQQRPSVLWPEADTIREWEQKLQEEELASPEVESLPGLSAPFQIPGSPSYFVGREEDLAVLQRILTSPEKKPTTVLTGLVGVGKSLVADRVLNHLKEAYPDGILWIDLVNSTLEAELISIAEAYKCGEAVAKLPDLSNRAEYVRGILADKKCLVVIDNVEEYDQFEAFNLSGEDNQRLITTRNNYLFANLPTDTVQVNPLTEDDGVALLYEILDDEERVRQEEAAARKIVRLVGGLPLALNIVASRLAVSKTMGLQEFADHISNEKTRLKALVERRGRRGRDRSQDNERRNIAASFELSYQELYPKTQEIFQGLAVFDGPDFSSEAVAAVLDVDIFEVKEELGELVSLSLLSEGIGQRDGRVLLDSEHTARYRLNPLLKVFVKEKLGDEINQLRPRMVQYYVELAGKHKLPQDYDQLDLDWQNIRQALLWGADNGAGRDVLRGVLVLSHNYLDKMGYLDKRGYYKEAQELLASAAQFMSAETPALIQARLLTNRGGFAVRQTNREKGADYLQQSLAILTELVASDERQLLLAYTYELLSRTVDQTDFQMGLDYIDQAMQLLRPITTPEAQQELGYLNIRRSGLLGRMGKMEEGLSCVENGLALLPEEFMTSARLIGLMNQANFQDIMGDFTACDQTLAEGITAAETLNDFNLLAMLKMNLSLSYQSRGRLQEARALQQESLSLYKLMGVVHFQGVAQLNLGLIYTDLGDFASAATYLKQALDILLTHELVESATYVYVNLVTLRLLQKDYPAATKQWEMAMGLCDEQDLAHLRPELLRQKAQLAIARGDIKVTQDAIEQSLTLTQEMGDQREEGISWRVQGDVWGQIGQHGNAVRAYETSLEKLQKIQPLEYGRSQLAWARYLLDTNSNLSQAQGMLTQSLETFQKAGASHDAERAQQLIATIS